MEPSEPKGRAGIKQIAAAVGVSIGTVDRVLHNRGGVNPKTVERVLKIAKQLSYTPNLAARNLKLNRRMRIGVFLPEQIASFFQPLRAGIEEASSEETAAPVDVSFHTYPRLGVGDVECMEQSDWQQFDGIILAPGDPNRLGSIARAAEQERKAMVFVATDAARVPRLSSIGVEAAVSGSIAAELLGQIIREKRSVVAVTGDLRIQDHAEKLRGFAATLATVSPHLRLLPTIQSHESPEDAYKAALELLESNRELGGIYINTANSMPVIRALKESGRLGKVCVIATDLFPELADMIESGHVFASLNQRPFTQGRMAFEILRRYLVSGISPRHTVRLVPHIVLRSNLSLFLDSLSHNEPA
jgi:LacI family transcriptional regulator